MSNNLQNIITFNGYDEVELSILGKFSVVNPLIYGDSYMTGSSEQLVKIITADNIINPKNANFFILISLLLNITILILIVHFCGFKLILIKQTR